MPWTTTSALIFNKCPERLPAETLRSQRIACRRTESLSQRQTYAASAGHFGLIALQTQPLPPPVERAISREAIDEAEWPYEDTSLKVIPCPADAS